MEDDMSRRLMRAAMLMLVVLVVGAGDAMRAHEGHDHTVMGTVTMAAADHVMLKDKDGKDVTVLVTRDTRVKGRPSMKVTDIKAGTRVVITGPMEKDQIKAKFIEVGVTAAAK
jgi:hypothetical protein